MQEKEYPFPDSDVSHIFDELLAGKLIELPEPNRPEEAGKVNDPKYCKYHRVVSHPIEKCFVVKDKTMALARDGKIILDSEDAPPALQFGSLEPAMVKVLLANEGIMNKENSIDKFEEDGEWILVTRRRRQRRCIDELHPLFLKKSYSPTVRKLNPVKVLKTPHVNFKKSSKSNHKTPVTLDDFFLKRLIMPITKIDSSPPNDSSPVKIPCQKLQGTFSPKVYKLLEKFGYDFSNPSGLGKLEPELTGKRIHEGDGKGKKPNDNYVSVFDRLGTPTTRPSVFGRLGSSS
ncbi:hypothetical protein BUALT_Bualt04G0019400 [Buddleja alternifolia]|uniref:Ty3-gypsy retrotransposon protein n=1 Tax=Buddleja alternifolia TaxID=168488 RepID=A0AAV6XTN7_9LAMI|nr:hypothetical protein BUALT_Bualt04G0019400 [Buddleja alternifolia]